MTIDLEKLARNLEWFENDAPCNNIVLYEAAKAYYDQQRLLQDDAARAETIAILGAVLENSVLPPDVAKAFLHASAMLSAGQSVPQWLPIETAPKDDIIIVTDGGHLAQVFWDRDKWIYGARQKNISVNITFPEPTHWMPLPPPPHTKGE